MGGSLDMHQYKQKISQIFIYIMNPCGFIIFSLLLLRLDATNANQLEIVGEGGGGGDDKRVVNKCFDKERYALLHFKARLQDPDGSLSTWRAEDHDCCKWSGVACNNQGYVTQLQIHGVAGRLVSEVSRSLIKLSYLSHLDLSHNYFHGTIPRFIGSLDRLRYLDLGGNGFDGTIPRSIGSLTELRHLDLSDNSLYGFIPPEFGNLTNLQVLYLREVGRCGVENLKWLSRLSHLQQLSMDGISLAKENHWVNVILSFRRLSYLSLQDCDLSQVLYPYSSFVNSSSSIVTLSLGNNNLTSSMFPWLFPLTSNKLRDLDLSSNMLDGIPKYLGNLCSLAGLKLDNNSAVVKFPDFVRNLSGCTSLTLQVLSASHSQFTGSLPDEIYKFLSLEELVLPESQLNGTISEKLWELPRLETLDVSFNHLRGVISANIGRSKPFIINLSNNSLEGVPSTDLMSNLSYVGYIDMSSCNLGPRFPKWIQTLKNLTRLNIANTRISDTMPLEFWDTWPSQLQYLNLSSNNISGKVPDLSSNFNDNSVIDLSSNKFYGPIPNVSSTLAILNLSRNKFYGEIFFLCQLEDGFLEFLDLSDNFLTGQLPDCLWRFKELKVLNLGNNSLFGRLPPSIGSLLKLEALYLYKNNLYGELPLSLQNCTSLNSLNLGANNFSGDVPVWIGNNLSGLYVLILRSNNFVGTIPLELCLLENLQILDLSMNHLHGNIPTCLGSLQSMVLEGFSQVQNVHHYYSLSMDSYRVDAAYVDHAMIEWQGVEQEFIRKNLGLLKIINLSSNNLTGQISYELTSLYGLIALNLSKNALVGEIPPEIGQMQNLVTLDLSGNKLSGGIPSSMLQLTFLGYLDVSCNQLSGRIPYGFQLQTFEASRYGGNAGLCGPPLTENCLGDEDSKVPPVVGESDIDELREWFYIGGAIGFVIGFWIACGTLFFNRRLRHFTFYFYDRFKDWIYVKVVVFIANLQRVEHT